MMDVPVLQTSGLTMTYPVRGRRAGGRGRAEVQALTDVDISVPRGGTLGVVGESGCGKSTLSRLLTRLEEPTAGRILLDGEDVTRARGEQLRLLRRRVQLVFQDPATAMDPRFTAAEAIGEPFRIHRDLRIRGGRAARVAELMELVGLNPDHGHRFPHEFSGGQRQRIGIARALALEPDVIILDEPVSALDLSVQAQVINLLQQLQRELGVSYVFVAHDLSVVRHISSQVAVMYLGRVVEQGLTQQVFTTPRHPYTQALLAAVPSRSTRLQDGPVLPGEPPSPLDPPSGCAFRTRCAFADETCAASVPGLTRAAGGTRSIACHHSDSIPYLPSPIPFRS